MSPLFGCILLISISLTIAIPLDGTCTGNQSCQDPALICDNGKCQCSAPSYIPCNSTCIINRHHAYVGDACAVQENCVENTICSVNKRCECKQGLTARNTLCLKNLYESCTNGAECWSDYCSSLRCQCAPGYELKTDNTTCTRKLNKIYNTWIEANRFNDFCSDDDSCIDLVAQCVSDTQNRTTKFCKCPEEHDLVENNTKCVSVESALLSPLNTLQASYGKCGTCKVQNAACMQAGEEKTCWCRAGYMKSNNACVKQGGAKRLITFPNSNDMNLHDFANGCINRSNSTSQVENKLCVCAPGYNFIDKDKPCEKIKSEWIDDIYEYGVCTRINSRYHAKGDNGLCPKPLKCEARKDKHVCSCGTDKFQDMDDPTQCVVFIGKTGNLPSDICPIKNAARNATSNICECRAGYKATNNNRQCGVKLSSQIFQPNCSSIRSNDKICNDSFGKTAFFCDIGDCRCSGNQSFPNSDISHCTALLNQELVAPVEDCPKSSALISRQCVCKAGFHPSSDLRHCVAWEAKLSEYIGPPLTTTGNITTADCRSIFSGPVELYGNDLCQCKIGTMRNSNKTGCWYRINVTNPAGETSPSCPPYSNADITTECQCNVGFTIKGNDCVRIVDKVYVEDDATATNTTGLTSLDCRTLFGFGSKSSDKGKYCICIPGTHPNADSSYCHYLINVTTIELIIVMHCPANTISPSPVTPRVCLCKSGYHAAANRRTCELANIALAGTDNVATPHTTNCVTYKDNDCIAKFGENAFCNDEKCYCDRRLSFIDAVGKCESLSKYTFPAVHEQNSYACTAQQDCGTDSNVQCDFLTDTSEYKVCKCKDGSILDPDTQLCVNNRCSPVCNTTANFECRDDRCVCKDGYHQVDNTCSAIKSNFQLNQICNASATGIDQLAAKANGLECDPSCGRIRCISGYKASQSKCVPYKLEEDPCVFNPRVCEIITPNATCYREKNKCSCQPSYYQADQTCARAVDSQCRTADQCGNNMICKSERCSCTENQEGNETSDVSGRPMKTCRNINNMNNTTPTTATTANPDSGIDQIRFTPMVLLLLLVSSRVFLT